MSTAQQLMAQQEANAIEIEKTIATIKKAPLERRTEVFYKSKQTELINLWQAFEKTENKIRNDPTLSEDNPYIERNLHKSIGEQYSSALEYIELQLKECMTQNTKPVPSVRTPLTDSVHQFEPRAMGLARRVKVRMTALTRLLDGLDLGKEEHPSQIYQVKIETINKLWSQVQELYDEIWQEVEDPSTLQLNQTEYHSLEDLVQHYLIELAVLTDKQKNPVDDEAHLRSNSSIYSSVPLPKVTIPQFDGDYLKWRQFHDLFSEMVDKQPISHIQKMWYLKGNVSGEAGQLISQYSLSETNHIAAWQTLKDRYNNKIILVANLVEKILNLPPVTSSASSIKTLHDTTKECLLALDNLGIETSSWSAIPIQLLIKKIDNTHVRYMQSLNNPRDVPSITEFLAFLELQFQSLEAVVPKDKCPHKVVSTMITTGNNMKATGTNIHTCKLCNGADHKLYHCSKFLQLSEVERLRWVQKKGLCVNCFGCEHTSKACTSSSCKRCAKRHNTLLHLEKKGNTKSKSTPAASFNSRTRTDTSASNVAAVTSATTNIDKGRQGHVLLATARVIITAKNGLSDEFRAILDSGSQVNIVSKRLCQNLSISPVETSLCLDGVGEMRRKSNYRINIEMKSRNLNFSANVEAYVLPSITPAQPNQHLDISTWGIPNNIHLADPHFYQQEKIDLLLGAEFFFKLTQTGTIHLADDLPILQNTALGWIVGGAIGKNSIPSPS